MNLKGLEMFGIKALNKLDTEELNCTLRNMKGLKHLDLGNLITTQ